MSHKIAPSILASFYLVETMIFFLDAVEDQLKALHQLQVIDTKIDKIRIIRGELPLEIEDLEDIIAGLEIRLEKFDTELKEINENIFAAKNRITVSSEAIEKYRNTLGAKVGKPIDQPDHGVTVVFINLPNTKIELLYPYGENSPITNFLMKNIDGGIHHICFDVKDIIKSSKALATDGAKILGSGKPKIGAHGKPVIFLHPKDFNGTLIELQQV